MTDPEIFKTIHCEIYLGTSSAIFLGFPSAIYLEIPTRVSSEIGQAISSKIHSKDKEFVKTFKILERNFWKFFHNYLKIAWGFWVLLLLFTILPSFFFRKSSTTPQDRLRKFIFNSSYNSSVNFSLKILSGVIFF